MNQDDRFIVEKISRRKLEKYINLFYKKQNIPLMVERNLLSEEDEEEFWKILKHLGYLKFHEGSSDFKKSFANKEQIDNDRSRFQNPGFNTVKGKIIQSQVTFQRLFNILKLSEYTEITIE